MPQGTHSFSFLMTVSKAREKDGKKYVTLDVSDNQKDFHGSAMRDAALASMQRMLKEGFKEDDGSLQKVYLLENHKATFEMGYGHDAEIVTDSNGFKKLTAEFELINTNPLAMQLYDEVKGGKCKKQASIGGDALVKPAYSKEYGETINFIEDVVKLEHVACTRAGQAAVASTGFISAIEKSLEPHDPKALTRLELGAMTDSERKKHATLVRDNTHSSTMYADGDKVYLLPIPDGDKNAAKVALREMGRYNATRAERKTVHDRAVEVLGDEHKQDGYCSFCPGSSWSDSVEYDKHEGDDMPVTDAEFQKLQKDTEDNSKMLREIISKMGGGTETDEQKTARLAKEKADKELADAQAALAAGPIAALAPVLKSLLDGQALLTETITKMAQPGSRTNAGVQNGAQIIQKEAASTAGMTAAQIAAQQATGENGGDGEDKYKAEKEKLIAVTDELDGIESSIRTGYTLKGKEQSDADQAVAEKSKLETLLRQVEPKWFLAFKNGNLS